MRTDTMIAEHRDAWMIDDVERVLRRIETRLKSCGWNAPLEVEKLHTTEQGTVIRGEWKAKGVHTDIDVILERKVNREYSCPCEGECPSCPSKGEYDEEPTEGDWEISTTLSTASWHLGNGMGLEKVSYAVSVAKDLEEVYA